VLSLAGLFAVIGLTMAAAPSGFGRLAHSLRISIPDPSSANEGITRVMGLVLLVAAVVVFIVWV
jgi:hypothetical protein